MSTVPSAPLASLPAEGFLEQLWYVSIESYFSAPDELRPGREPVGAQKLVLARNRDQAIRKTLEVLRAELRDGVGPYWDQVEANAQITARVVTLEELVVTLHLPGGGGSMPWNKPIELSLPEDVARFRLAACLVPVESIDG